MAKRMGRKSLSGNAAALKVRGAAAAMPTGLSPFYPAVPLYPAVNASNAAHHWARMGSRSISIS